MKASAAIDKTAEVTGILRATVFGVARSMREADPTLWPEGSAGRNQAADVEPQHVFNLGLGIALADPITNVFARVQLYRSLEADGEWMPRRRSGIAELMQPSSQPEWPALDTLASFGEWAIGRLTTDAAWRSDMKAAGLRLVILTGGVRPMAWLETHDWRFHFSQPLLEVAARPEGPILTEKTIPFALLATFADIWADTLANRAKRETRNTGGATGSARSRNKKAGTPGRAPALSDSLPYDDTRLDTDTQRKVIGPHKPDDNARVCPSSSGFDPTPRTRNRHYDARPASPFYALL